MKRLAYVIGISVFMFMPVISYAAILQVPADYPTIQQAITAAGSGDNIVVSGGPYPEKLTITTPGITIGGDGSYPLLNPALATSSKYDTVISVQADNVTVKGLEITNALGVVDTGGNPGGTHIEHHAIWDKVWVLGPSGLTVDDCRIHDIEHGVRSYGPDLTVKNCEMYNLRRSGVHASGPHAGSGGSNQPLSMFIQGNWFHDWISYYKEGAGIHVKYRNRIGVVSHNYISGMRMGIAYYYGGPWAGYGDIVFAHNTIDMDYDLGSGPVLMTMGFSLWGTGYNAGSVIIRDNIFANARWYGIYQEGATISGSILVDNNLFFNNYWFYWPGYQYPYQWFGSDSLAQAGWTGGADGFNFTNNLTVQNPLFTLDTPGAEGQWGLQPSSPACNAASDSTNIGAWQGPCNQPPVITCLDPVVSTDPSECHASVSCDSIALCEDPDSDPLITTCDPEGPYPVGVTTVTITCFDGTSTTTAECTVTVEDNEAPVCNVTVDHSWLWPPNHKMVDVGLSVTVNDNCDSDPVTEILVTSDESPSVEPDDECPDAVIMPDNVVLLRAERLGDLDGRVYIIKITATDAAGNTSECFAEVEVPHDLASPAVDSGQFFDPTICP